MSTFANKIYWVFLPYKKHMLFCKLTKLTTLIYTKGRLPALSSCEAPSVYGSF